MKDLADRAIPISISSFLSIASAIAVLWFLFKPIMVAEIKAEIQGDIQNLILSEQRPLQNAFKQILQSSINVNRRAIAKLEFDRDHNEETWSSERAAVLADRYIEVQALERAYNEL